LVVAATAAILAATFLPALRDARAASSPRARAAALRAQQAAFARSERETVLELFVLETRVARARGDVASLRARSAQLARERQLARRRAAAVRHSLATARRRLVQALRTLYQHGQPDPVAIVLGATSVDQAVQGIDDLRRAAQANRRLIADLRRKETRVKALEAELRARDRRLAEARRSAEAAVAQLEAMRVARTRSLASLRARRGLTRRQIASLDELARKAQRRSALLTARSTRAGADAATATPVATRAAPHPGSGGQTSMVVDAVAYHLPGRTASGLPVGIGIVAVDPSVIPLGTRMFVPGYGPAVAADVGSAVRGTIIDLWMPSRAKALAWGRRTVTITLYG
jgi:3D (Asp-Asp-Asp) domain-containing protein